MQVKLLWSFEKEKGRTGGGGAAIQKNYIKFNTHIRDYGHITKCDTCYKRVHMMDSFKHYYQVTAFLRFLFEKTFYYKAEAADIPHFGTSSGHL
jgi:hypothetical protein